MSDQVDYLNEMKEIMINLSIFSYKRRVVKLIPIGKRHYRNEPISNEDQLFCDDCPLDYDNLINRR